MGGGCIPENWLKPCAVFRCDRQKPVVRGGISRIREALLAIANAVPEEDSPEPRVGRDLWDGAAKTMDHRTRRLVAACGSSVTHSVTNFGQREISIEKGGWSEAVRIRFWMPTRHMPVDPDLDDAETSMRNLRNYVRLVQAHLKGISKAVRNRSDETDFDAQRGIVERCRRVATVARVCAESDVRVESGTPWSAMEACAVSGVRKTGTSMPGFHVREGWVNPPSFEVRMEGGRHNPLILSVVPVRVEVGDVSKVEAMRAVANLPAGREDAA